MPHRRHLLLATGAVLLARPSIAPAQEAPGVTATEIRIGSTNALSGPLSSYSVISRCNAAMFRRLNDEGGVGGRKINFIVYDDGFQPPKTLEQTRRLVEQDRVAFLFNNLGTATNSAIQRYVNQRKIPHLFLATGADKWANPQEFPWTMGWQPSYRVETQIYAKHFTAEKPDARVAVLYQNDDFGKDFVSASATSWARASTPRCAWPATRRPTRRSTARSSSCRARRGGAGPRRRAALRRAGNPQASHDIGWKPTTYLREHRVLGRRR